MDPDKAKPEKMERFFNTRADSYDEHMAEYVDDYEGFYDSIAKAIGTTDKEVKVLDLGCGTGLELEYIFKQAPNALVTGIDLSQEMLARLLNKYWDKGEQIEVIRGSYLELDFKIKEYDYVVSVMSLHHFLPEVKLKLYNKIWAALKPGGIYIEGDYVVSEDKEAEMMADYQEQLQENKVLSEDLFHLDIPFSIESQQGLFEEAGFTDFELIFAGDEAGVYSVKKY